MHIPKLIKKSSKSPHAPQYSSPIPAHHLRSANSKKPSSLTRKTKVAEAGVPQSASLRSILSKLAQNSLTEFKVGFEPTSACEFQSKRDIERLHRVVTEQWMHKVTLDQYSPLTSIQIGWRLPKWALGPLLSVILPLLLAKPSRVTKLQLVLDTWVPFDTLVDIVSNNQLQELNLSAVKARRRNTSSPLCEDHAVHSSSNSSSADESVFVVLPHLSKSITKLKLIDCDMTSQDVRTMCEEWKHMPSSRHIQSLSLRHNRSIDGRCLSSLLGLPLQTLDLSLCDLDASDGRTLARVLRDQPPHRMLQALNVAGNYRLAPSIPLLVQVAATRLSSLDLSYCDVQNRVLCSVFEELAIPNNDQATLKVLKLHSSHLRAKAVVSLCKCIQHNTSLRKILIDHEREPYPISVKDWAKIAEALPCNYYLSEISMDTAANPPHERKMIAQYQEQMRPWLELNACGRRLLWEKNGAAGLNWANVLGQAAQSNDPNILHWLITTGSAQLFRGNDDDHL